MDFDFQLCLLLYISIQALHGKYHGVAQTITWSGVVFMVHLR